MRQIINHQVIIRRVMFALAAAALPWTCVATPSIAADIFALKSTTFEDGKIMPKRVANSRANAPDNPNCVGDNVSPELSWSHAPAGTRSFALLMIDPEGRAPGGVNHWVAYGIPATVTGFAEGEVSKPSDKYDGGRSSRGVGFYSGPCTPPNTTPHHYTFVLVATDFEPGELLAGLTRDELIAKFGPAPAHLKGSTGLIGLFVNPYHE